MTLPNEGAVVTVWTRLIKKKDGTREWRHNHVSAGYDTELKKPVPKFDSQRSWFKDEWKSRRAPIRNNTLCYD